MTEGTFSGKTLHCRGCKWSQMKERPRVQLDHLFDFKGPLSLKEINKKKHLQRRAMHRFPANCTLCHFSVFFTMVP